LDSEVPLPEYAYPGDAGLDLSSTHRVTLMPGERQLISTGISIALPIGYAAFVQPRSGLALRSGLGIVNSPGLIDSQYRGEIKVIAINFDQHEPIHIERGDRIAQLVIQPIASVRLVEVLELDATERGEGGFGSSS